jgi:CRISPR system Cascade subunit CasD
MTDSSSANNPDASSDASSGAVSSDQERLAAEPAPDERLHLFLQLHGALAAWGDVAVGEVRPTFDRPSKSAVLGIVAAALGIGRAEEEQHQALTDAYRFAVRLDVPGRLLRDYHTTETPTGKRARGLPTRRDELNYKSTTTIQSYRDYRCDAFATACLWTDREAPPWSLREIGEALQTPAYSLYLGRKACPPSLPLAPELVAAPTLRAAFEQAQAGRGPFATDLREAVRPGSAPTRLYWEDGPDIGFDADQVQHRRDELVSRQRWQYREREEQVVQLAAGDPAAP